MEPNIFEKHSSSRIRSGLSLFCLTFPSLNLILTLALFNIRLDDGLQLLAKPTLYLISGVVWLAAYGLWDLKRWSWPMLVFSQLLIFYQNLLLLVEFSHSPHPWLALLFSGLIQAIFLFQVSQEIRVPYFFPRIHWWENNSRYSLAIPVALLPETSLTKPLLASTILDLSPQGCFIKTREDLPLNQVVQLRFTYAGLPIQCKGLIVWITATTVTRPAGIGVKFFLLSSENRKALKLIHRRLKKLALFYRQFRYLYTPEEFLKNLEKIENQSLAAPPLAKKAQSA